MLNKAIEIAAKAHSGQVDKVGANYIFHPLRVMLGCKTEEEKICAVLHDVLEDTAVTRNDLFGLGFGEDILDALDHLTKKDGEDYMDFIKRAAGNKIALKVKIQDLIDNSNSARLIEITKQDKVRLKKYGDALDYLYDVLRASETEVKSYEYRIEGVVEVPNYISEEVFETRFFEFLEAQNCYFGGGIGKLDKSDL